MKNTFGSYIKKKRHKLNYTLQELCSLVKCSRPYLSDIENDKRIPSLKMVNELAAHLHVESEMLAIKATKFRIKRTKEKMSDLVKSYRAKKKREVEATCKG